MTSSIHSLSHPYVDRIRIPAFFMFVFLLDCHFILALKTVLIDMKFGLLFGIRVLLLYRNIQGIASKRSYKYAQDSIDDLCDDLLHEDLRSEEDQRWKIPSMVSKYD